MIFDNYEIWWITGAQLLYGGDAVVKVCLLYTSPSPRDP